MNRPHRAPFLIGLLFVAVVWNIGPSSAQPVFTDVTTAAGIAHTQANFPAPSKDMTGGAAAGDVDGDDFLVWQAGFGRSTGATHMQGDSDGDGDVDANDLLAWQSEFGNNEGSAGTSNAAVPEPMTLGMGMVLLAAFTCFYFPSRPLAVDRHVAGASS